MEYSVSRLAKLSGVSARTLRYYDEIGLLKPNRINSSGYRIYGETEVDLLQQILFYRELEFSLDEIKGIMQSEDFDVSNALQQHLIHLTQQKKRLESLIDTVTQSLQATRGERTMTDEQKFAAFKKDLIDKNEIQYGEEIREKYGNKTMDESNKQMAGMTKQQWETHQTLDQQLNYKLKEAVRLGDPSSELAQAVCDLHRQWLTNAWPRGHYDKLKHFNLSLMYVHDERFKAYYEKIEPGAADFLHEALKIYCEI